MDRRNKKNEETDKKIDYRVKDRGDLKKCNDKSLKKIEGITNMNLAYPECGDSLEKESANQKIKLNGCVKKANNEDIKMKYLISGTTEKEFLNKNNYNKDKQAKSHSELRKRIRDRYTMKLNSPVNKSEHISLFMSKKEDGALNTDRDKRDLFSRPSPYRVKSPKKQMYEETTQTVDKSNYSSTTSANINMENKPDTNPDKKEVDKRQVKKRKPIIRTIMSKTGPVRIFKAVTFVDQHSMTPLEIKIPAPVMKKQQKLSKYTETSSLKFKPKVTVSKVSSNKPSIKEEKLTKLAAVRKRAERRRDRKFRYGSSPTCSVKEPPSPPTEVARWTAASTDPQTIPNIPYYEAWINTTLAAISKNSKQDKLAYEQQEKFIRSFQKVLDERPTSPELFYENFADEKYTGRIKIRQTERSIKKQQVVT